MKIKISNGRVLDPLNNLDAKTDIYISDGKILSVGKAPQKYTAEKTIDASGLLVIPGLIDLCARMREPGLEHKATILSESRAAVAGGVTTVCCPPDTDPIIDTPAVAELIHQRAQAANRCRVFPIAAATHSLDGKTLSEMQALKNIGCIAVSNAYNPIKDSEVLRRLMEYAYTCDMTAMLFCEDESLKNDGTAHEGHISMTLGLPGIPETAETTAISRALLLAEQTGIRLHICRLSTARAVDMINDAKSKGLSVTADVSIQHLYLSEVNLQNFNSQCYLRPPLRTTTDKKALLEGVKEGIVDAICSDHQPHDDDAKSAPFSLTEPGASSLEHFLPLVMNLIERYSIDPLSLLKSVTTNPAGILAIEAGNFNVGNSADVCLFDPQQSMTINSADMISAGKNTPFDGLELSGTVASTMVGGNIVFEQK